MHTQYWGMLATDANWDRYICFGARSNDSFVDGGEFYGPSNNSFRFPAGVSLLTDQDLYICDAYHNRVAKFTINLANDTEIITSAWNFNFTALNFPIDVDAAHIPDYAPINWDCTFHNWVAVCDQGNDRIVVTGLQGGYNFTLGHGDPAWLYLNRPTSVAFAREHQMGWPRNDIYIADAGNNRVVKCVSADVDGGYTHFVASHDTVFADNSYLTSVDVDPFGQVYVLDSYNGTIYKFDEDLQFIGKWGSLGTDENHLYYPSRLSNARGWQDVTDTLCVNNPILYPKRIGDILVTELYSATTGIKRYYIGNDLLDFQAGYQQRICNYSDDYFFVEWEQADYGPVNVMLPI